MIDEAGITRRRRQREVFHELFDLPAQERAKRIASIERSDLELAAQLRALLREADADLEDDGVRATQPAGTLIGGRFRLLRLLGIGGMGEVYLAERVDGVDKKVALKLVRGDLPVPIARARRERQILARLNHANIAGLLDAGLSRSGQPWFAMEYVIGETITHWCDRRALGLKDRARLLAQVCRVVQFAHRSLVLHRDLKPSNILVNEEGVPKLLDFGIAKLLDATDPQQTQTLVVTPAYASPEQVSGARVTTASDIYQLGLLLYELVCGIPAHAARSTTRSDPEATSVPRLDQALQAIRAGNRQRADAIAEARGVGVDRLRRHLKGDLGRIVGKAIATPIHERYGTAQALADDLERWANELPVDARQGSVGYRVGKMIRRHKAASVAIALLSVGLVTTSVFALNRAREEHVQRERAEQQRAIADGQRARAEQLVTFLRDAFREANPENTQGQRFDLPELLSRASAKLGNRTDLDTVTKAVLMTQIADVLENLGQFPQGLALAARAKALLEESKFEHAVDYLQSVATLVAALAEAGSYRDEMEVIDAALPLAERTSGGEHLWLPYLLAQRAWASLWLGHGDEAERDVERAFAEFERRGGGDSRDFGEALNMAAIVSSLRGDERRALGLFRRSLANAERRGDERETNVLIVKTSIANSDCLLGDADRGIALLAPLIAQYDRLLAPGFDRSVNARTVLAGCYIASANYAAARETLAGFDVNATLTPQTQMGLKFARARLAMYAGQLDQAIAMARALVRNDAADESASRLKARNLALLGEALHRRGDDDEARTRLEAGLRMMRLGTSTAARWRAAPIEDSLGRTYLALGDLDRAKTHLRQAVTDFRAGLGAGKPNTLRSEIHLLWAQAVEGNDADVVERIRAKRSALREASGGADIVQVRQVDLLIADLHKRVSRNAAPHAIVARESRRAPGEPAAAGVAMFTGLNDF